VPAAIAKAQGVTVDQMKAALVARAAQVRTTELATQDRLGLSPAMLESVANEADLFGGESGADQNMGVIESVGGSESAIEGNEAPVNYVDSVAPNDNAKRAAAAEEMKFYQEALSHPEVRRAIVDWEDTKSDGAPSFKEMSLRDQAGWVHEYARLVSEGAPWSTIEAAQRNHERDLNDGTEQLGQDTRLEGPASSVEGQVTAGTGTARAAISAPVGSGISERDETPQPKAAPAPKVTSKKKRTTVKVAPVDVAGTEWAAEFYATAEEVWDRDIVGPAAVTPFKNLTDTQKYVLLDALKNGDEETQGGAVQSVLKEINTVDAEAPAFSEGPTKKASISSRLLSWAKLVATGRTQEPVAMILANPSDVLRSAGIYRAVTMDFEHARHIMNTHPEIKAEDIAALPDLTFMHR